MMITCANEALQIELDPERGTLTRLTALESGWEIVGRPQLGQLFRLLLPLPGRRNNRVLSERQPPPMVTMGADNRAVSLHWPQIVSEHGGEHPVAVTLEIVLATRQATFSLTIVNRAELTVESAAYPCLGDLRPPPGAAWFKSFSTGGYVEPEERLLWPHLLSTAGYWGVDVPTQTALGVPRGPFVLLRGPAQGLYVGVALPSPELVAWQAELSPGYGSTMHHRAPAGTVIDGHPVALSFAAVQLPYVRPGETRALSPITLEPYAGDWEQGVECYRRWRDSWRRPATPPAWVVAPHSWQQLHLSSPEAELRLPFHALPAIGAECARNGVSAIQLVGWNDGGQDGNNPCHAPDPRLGTPAELRAAIAAIQAQGVKVVLFAKFTWADRSTARYRDELHRLAVKDPYGDPYIHPGYQYQTAAQLLDINTHRLVPMCFLSEAYLRLCEAEFRQIVALGADGMLFDECQHHGPALLCFDPDHGHRPGAPVYANDRELIRRLARLAPPGFLFAGEACYDWELEVYQLAYIRSDSRSHLPAMRYLQERTPIMTALSGFDDRSMVNQCLLYRYLISYEPFNFKGRLGDFPRTLAYGRQMDALRAALCGYFWEGTFLHERGARVTVAGQPHHPYAVHRHADGSLGLAIANYDLERPMIAQVQLADRPRPGRYRLIDDPNWHLADDGVRIPPASAAVVLP